MANGLLHPTGHLKTSCTTKRHVGVLCHHEVTVEVTHVGLERLLKPTLIGWARPVHLGKINLILTLSCIGNSALHMDLEWSGGGMMTYSMRTFATQANMMHLPTHPFLHSIVQTNGLIGSSFSLIWPPGTPGTTRIMGVTIPSPVWWLAWMPWSSAHVKSTHTLDIDGPLGWLLEIHICLIHVDATSMVTTENFLASLLPVKLLLSC